MKSAQSAIPLAGLWVGWFACLPIPFAALLLTGNSRWTRLWWASSAVLALAAWSHWFLQRQRRDGPFTAWIAGGMTCGLLADLYGFFEVIRFSAALPMIILLFGLGHVCYIAGMLTIAKRRQLTGHARWQQAWQGAILIYGLIGTGLWLILVRPSPALPELHAPTAVYTLLLAAAAAAMLAAAALDRRFLVMGAGGLLFMISDAFLAVRLFQDNRYGIGDLCWITYGIGQMLIVYGAVRAAWTGEYDHASSSTEAELTSKSWPSRVI
jgi:hypothetical protein